MVPWVSVLVLLFAASAARAQECYDAQGMMPLTCDAGTDCDLLYCETDAQCRESGKLCEKRQFYQVEPVCDDYPYPYAYVWCESNSDCDVEFDVCVEKDSSCAALPGPVTAPTTTAALLAALFRRRRRAD